MLKDTARVPGAEMPGTSPFYCLDLTKSKATFRGFSESEGIQGDGHSLAISVKSPEGELVLALTPPQVQALLRVCKRSLFVSRMNRLLDQGTEA